MNDSKHAPTPWRQGENPWNVHSADGRLIGSASFYDGHSPNARQSEEVSANAALIVRAVNERAELLAALSKLLQLVDDVRDSSEGRYPSVDPGCIECTRGVTPDRFNTGLCTYHAAKALLTRPPEGT